MHNNQFSRGQATLIAVSLIILIIGGISYSKHSETYPLKESTAAKTSYKFTVDNSEDLLNWMPLSLYNFTMARFQDYVDQNNLDASTTHISAVRIEDSQYTFNIKMEPEGSTAAVEVAPLDYDGSLTAAVTINGRVQSISASNQVQDTSFSGLSDLQDIGITSFQIKGLQQSLDKFQSAAEITIVKDSIQDNAATGDSKPYVSFTVKYNEKEYKAKMEYSDITVTRLYIYDLESNKQLFDSGDVDVQS